MGCCLFAAVLAGAPRLANVIWWLFRPAYWFAGFSGWPIVWWLWPTLGIAFLPWTTLMYVIVYPNGLSLINWVFLGLAFAVDIASYGSGEKGRRDRLSSNETPSTGTRPTSMA